MERGILVKQMQKPGGVGRIRRLAIALVIALGLVSLAASASAHEHRTVGDYELTVGFLNEPAILEEPNGLDLRVQKGSGDAGQPVEGLADSLQAEVRYGGQSMPLELSPVFGRPGAYRGNFIPTAEGAYTFHITGTIEGTPIDEQFTSSPTTFSEVESRATMTFPNTVEGVGAVQEAVESAKDTANTAQLIGIAGVVVGFLGLVAGVAGLMAARGARPQTQTRTDMAGEPR